MYGKIWTVCVELNGPGDAIDTWCSVNPNEMIGTLTLMVQRDDRTIIWANFMGNMPTLLSQVAKSSMSNLRIDVWFLGCDGPYAGYQSAVNGKYEVNEVVVQGPVNPFYTECHNHCCPECIVTSGYVTEAEFRKGVEGFKLALSRMEAAKAAKVTSPLAMKINTGSTDKEFSDSFPL